MVPRRARYGRPVTPGPPSDPVADDEWLHPPGPDPRWTESWYFDLAAPDGSVGAYVRVGLLPHLGVAWYWAAVARPGHPTVIVREHEAAHPRRAVLELRHEGLWADHVCEEPGDRWSLGLEAFGVALTDPADAFHGERGHRTPVGWDLEWERSAPARRRPDVAGYAVPSRVHGEILVGHDVIGLDGVPGVRTHAWGPLDWWAGGWCWAAWHTDHSTHLGLAVDDHIDPRGFEVQSAVDDEGLLVSASVHLDGDRWRVEPVAHAPLLLADGPRTARLARTLARWHHPDGSAGVGWLERNQPWPRRAAPDPPTGPGR